MKKRLFVVLIFVFMSFFNRLPFSLAAEIGVDPREAAIDRAIGGMQEGSRPLEPKSHTGKTDQAQPVPGGNLSPSADTRVTASANASAGTGGVNANLGGNVNAGTGSGGLQGSAQETAGGGTAGTTPEGETSTGGSTESPAEPTSDGSSGDSIVNADANVDLSGGDPTVDANLAVDTNADTLLDADTSATTDATSVDATVAESGTVAGQDLTTTVNDALVDATLDSEVVATDAPAESEATAGLEADIDPVAADSDIAPADPADGLSTGL